MWCSRSAFWHWLKLWFYRFTDRYYECKVGDDPRDFLQLLGNGGGMVVLMPGHHRLSGLISIPERVTLLVLGSISPGEDPYTTLKCTFGTYEEK